MLSLVVLSLPSRQGHLYLDLAVLEVHRAGDNRQPFFLRPPLQKVDLFPMHEQLPFPPSLRLKMAGVGVGLDVQVHQPKLPFSDLAVSIRHIHPAQKHRLDLRSLKHHPRLIGAQELVVELRATIDDRARRFELIRTLLLFGHVGNLCEPEFDEKGMFEKLLAARARKRPASVPKPGCSQALPGTFQAMTRLPVALALSSLIVLAAGCSKDNSGKTSDPGKNQGSNNSAGLKELKKTDVVVGKGQEAATGDMVFMKYTGKLKNGTTFDSNDKPGASPLGFVIGGEGIIKGWQLGIPGMKVGGKRKLEIPASLAYGAQSPPNSSIPPNSDLYFDVELLDLIKPGEENVYDKTDLVQGAGPSVAAGDTVTIHYEGKLVNGRRFDSTYERKKPETFTRGKGDVIKGLEAGIIGMKPGGKRRLRIPPGIGYGSYGLGHVPQGSITIFEVELLKVKKG